MLLDNLPTYRRRTWSPSKKPLPPPSQRDLEIYKRVRIWGHRQWEVAGDLNVHYSRISQIVKRVEAWLAAGGSPNDPKLTSALAERKLSRSLQKLRLQRAVELASAAVHGESQPLTKTRRRMVGSMEVWREETQADSPSINLFALQNYLAAVKALEAFEQNEENPQAAADKPEQLTSSEALLALVNLLCRFRIEAEAAGQVTCSGDIRALVVTTLERLLGANCIPPLTAPPKVPLNLSATRNTPSTPTPSQPQTSTKDDMQSSQGGAPNLSASSCGSGGTP